jgi:hypothetical protein
MKKISIIIIPALFVQMLLFAQDQDQILVEAGTSLLDHVPVSERYLYPAFTTGWILLKQHAYSERKLNYNFLNGEIEFLQGSDTLSIVNKKDIALIVIKEDTFYYHDDYVKQIRSDYPKVGIRDFYELKEIKKKDPYGISSAGSARISYNALPSDGNLYKLTGNQDMVFGKTREYYLATSWSGFLLVTRKNLRLLYPGKWNRIKAYLKSHRLKFDSQDDVLGLAAFIGTL